MSSTTAERVVVVGSRVGLHARPAAAVAKLATDLPVTVSITNGERVAADARSLLMILALGASCGDELILKAEGEGAEDAVTVLADLIATDQDA